MYAVYAIRSPSDRLYVGQTRNVEMRIRRHNSGYVKSTNNECPWELIAVQYVDDRNEARWIERSLKNSLGKRNAWLRKYSLNAYGSESEISE
jgi:putative endonuclease